MSPNAALSIEDLVHRYGERTVLSLDRWQVERGEAWLVTGPSGCGKSTLLAVVTGLLRPTSGSVRVIGQNIVPMQESRRDRFRGQHVGFVPQVPHLLATLTVIENLLLAQFLAGVAQNRALARSLLARLGVADRARAKPDSLSRGEAQRVTLARAIINRPALLLADEPTANLDDAACSATLDLLRETAAASEATLIVATHDARVKPGFVRQLALAASP